MKLILITLAALGLSLWAFGQAFNASFLGAANPPVVAGGGGTPDFGGILNQSLSGNVNDTSVVYYFSNSVPNTAGNRIVIHISASGAQTVSADSIVDARSNTYTKELGVTNGLASTHFIFSAPVTTSISGDDTFTISFTAPNYTYREVTACYVTGTTALDVASVQATGYGTTATATADTTADTIGIGWTITDTSATVTIDSFSGSWTAIGNIRNNSVGGFNFSDTYSKLTSGTKTMVTTLSGNASFGTAMVAYK